MQRKSFFFIVGGLSLGMFVLGLFSRAEAASIYFSPEGGTFEPGKTAVFEVRLDPQHECINTVQIDVGFPEDLIEIVSVNREPSIFPIWISAPAINNESGFLSMAGGVPGGYCGPPPQKPISSNVVAKLTVRFSEHANTLPVHGRISVLDSSRVILHDGRGTETNLKPGVLDFTIAAAKIPNRSRVWWLMSGAAMLALAFRFLPLLF